MLSTILSTMFVNIKSNILITSGVMISFLLPVQPLLICIFICTLVDAGFGIWASKKNNVKITSKRATHTLIKLLVYGTLVIIVFILDKLILGEFLRIFSDIENFGTKVTAILIVANEIYSVDEKLRGVNEGKGLYFYFKRALSAAKKVKSEVNELKN